MPARRGGGGGGPSAAAAGSPSAHPPHSAAATDHHQYRTSDANTSGGMVALHRARFVDWSPSPVVAAAASADGSVLAAAREDGGLELWETEGWSCVLRIPGSEGACITSLAWVTVSADDEDEGDHDDDDEAGGAERGATATAGAGPPPQASSPAPAQALVSAGLDGALTLWDLRARAPGSVLDAGGGAIWSLAVDERGNGGGEGGEGGEGGRRLAAACDDGAIRVFVAVRGRRGGSGSSSSAPSLKLSAALPRAAGRALSVAWHPGGRALVSGSSEGTLRAWDVASRRELFRVDAAGGSGESSKTKSGGRRGSGGDDSSSPLWAVAVAADGTLATGDGSGCVSLWDAEHGTLLARFPGAHASDVLALVAAGGGGGGGGGGGSSWEGRGGSGGIGRRRGRGGGAGDRRSYEGAGAGGTIFSAGADGRVASFVHQGGEDDERRVRQRSGEQHLQQQQQSQQQRQRNGGWAAGPARAAHTHDVRCLALLSPSSGAVRGGQRAGEGGGHSKGGRPAAAAAGAAAGLLPQLLVSGGADAQLIVYARSSFATEHPARASRAPQPPLLSVSVPVSGDGGAGGGGPALLLASQRRAVDVWRLGASALSSSSDPTEEEHAAAGRGKRGGGKAAASATAFAPGATNLAEGARVDVAARPARLARLELAGSDHVLASALSSSYSAPSSPPSGGSNKNQQQQQLLTVAVAASTPARTVLFEVREEEEEVGNDGSNERSFSVRRVPLPAGVPPSAAVAFAGPRRLLAASCEDGSLSVIDLSARRDGAEEEEEGGAKTPAVAAASLAATLAAPASSKNAATSATSTAALSCPPVSGLAVSDCGRWAATWSTSGRCHVFDLKGLEHAWSPPPMASSSSPQSSSSSFPACSSLLAGAAFTADGDLLLLSSSGALACYDVQGRFLRPPHGAGAAAAGTAAATAAAMATTASVGENLPGSPTGVSALPKAGSRAVLVCTPSALCSADLAAPRTPGRDDGDDSAADSRRSRRAARAAGAAAHSTLLAPAPAGTNPRPLPLEHPCLGSFFLSAKEALLVEAVWADVAARSLPPPVLRRRFGA